MDDKIEIKSEIERLEDGFEILTMDSYESKTELKKVAQDEKSSDKGEVKSNGLVNNQASTLEYDSTNEQRRDHVGIKGSDAMPDEAWNWNSWTNWGTSVINTAASSVTTFTSQVGDGLIHVLETVESGLLAQEEENGRISQDPLTTDGNINPQVEELNEDKKDAEDETTKEEFPGISSGKSWFFSSLSNVVNKTTSVVQQTTNVVVHGGLDMLESIGKKTYDVITDGDHGLKKVLEKNKQRRKMPNLSLALKEAREIAELKSREEESLLESKKFLYGYWFDEYQGLVQLEAFELLANQNEARTREEYNRLPKDKLATIRHRLAMINDVYKVIDEDNEDDDIDDKQDFNHLLLDYVAKLPVNISVQKLLECQEQCREWLHQHENWNAKYKGEGKDLLPKDVLGKSMQSLAEMTALSIQHFHKLAQLLAKTTSSTDSPLVDPTLSNVSAVEMAQNVVEFSRVLSREFSVLSGKFATLFGRFETLDSTDSEILKEVSEYITTVYLEASHSNNFIQRSLKLLLPVLQLVAMNQ